jgi:hypothetical protein
MENPLEEGGLKLNYLNDMLNSEAMVEDILEPVKRYGCGAVEVLV